jgi:hypothetical protein
MCEIALSLQQKDGGRARYVALMRQRLTRAIDFDAYDECRFCCEIIVGDLARDAICGYIFANQNQIHGCPELHACLTDEPCQNATAINQGREHWPATSIFQPR